MNKLTRCLLFAGVIAASSGPLHAQSNRSWGPYVRTKGPGGDAELMMADIMTPAEGVAPYTYSCAVQFGIGKSGGYCGLQDATGNDSVRPFNNIFSIWDFPSKIQIIDTYKDQLTMVGGFGHEGTGLHSHTDFGWKPGNWYTNVVRRWYAGGDKTYVGYFIYDHTNRQWKHYVTFAVPEANAMLHGNIASFLENFGDESNRARLTYYKSYWKLSPDGKWTKPDSLQVDGGVNIWFGTAYGNDGIAVTSGGGEKNRGTRKSFPVSSTDLVPQVVSVGEIYDMGAYYDRQQKKVYVDWGMNLSKAPQLSYAVELYDKQGDGAKPIASAAGYGPEIRSIEISTNALSLEQKDYYIVLKVQDIFGHSCEPKNIVLEQLKP